MFIRCVVVAALAVGSIFSSALAQRSVMVTDDGEGNRQFLTYTVVRAEQLGPAYTVADLPFFIEELALSEGQVAALERLLDEYIGEHESLEMPELNPIAEMRERGGGGPGVGGRDPGAVLRDALEEVGLDPGLLSRDQINVGVNIGMDQSPEEDRPRLNVGVSIEPAEGVTFDDETKAKLEQAAAKLAEHIESAERERMEARMRGEDPGPGMVGDAGTREDVQNELEAQRTAVEDMRAAVESYRREAKRLARSFEDAVRALLAEEQVERWPALERRLRREKTMAWGDLGGESLDLIKLVDRTEFDASVEEAVYNAIEAYEIALDTVLKRRNELLETTGFAVDRALLAGDADKALSMEQRLLKAREAVRDVNLSHIDLIGSSCGSEGPAFIDEARALAYPMIHSTTPADRAIDAVAELDLADEVRGAIDLFIAEYDRAWADATRSLEKLYQRHERQRSLRSLAGVLEILDPAMAEMFEEPRDPISEALERRLDLDRRTMEAIYGLLPKATVERLPRIPEKGEDSAITAERGDG